MESEKTTNLIIPYLMGDMSPAEQKSFEKLIANDPQLKEEFQQHKEVFMEWRTMKVATVPSDRIQHFQNWLDKEKNSPAAKVVKIIQLPTILKYVIAASFAILIIFSARWYLHRQAGEKLQMQRGDLLQLVAAESTTSRIKGINQYQNISAVDSEIRDVFIRVLSNDISINVRLAALEALSNLSGDELVKEALIRILEQDDEPAIQMAIINVLVQWKDRNAKQTLEDLLSRDQVPDDVKEEAFLGVTRL